MGKPKKRKRKIRVRTGAKVVKKDSVRNDMIQKDTLKKAPFIMNDNGLNMRIKIKRKSR